MKTFVIVLKLIRIIQWAIILIYYDINAFQLHNSQTACLLGTSSKLDKMI